MVKNIWKDIGDTPIDFATLVSLFPEHAYKYNKISALEKDGTLMRIKQGLYVPNPEITGEHLSESLIANHLYGPSYVSLYYALRYYSLIPEGVFTITSLTLKRSRVFKHLQARIKEFNGVDLSEEEFLEILRERLGKTNSCLSDIKG